MALPSCLDTLGETVPLSTPAALLKSEIMKSGRQESEVLLMQRARFDYELRVVR